MLKSKLQNLLADLQNNPNQAPSAEGFQASMPAQPAQEDPVAKLRQMASRLGQHKANKALEVAPVSNPVEGMEQEAQPYQAPSLEEIQADKQAQQESLNQMVPEEQAPDVNQVIQQASNLGQAKAEQAAQPEMQGFNDQMNDEALAKALQQQKSDKNRNMMIGALLDSTKAGALSVGKNSSIDNSDYMKALDEQANADVGGLQMRRKGMSEEESLKQSRAKSAEDKDMLAKADPKSGISKSVREFAKKMGLNPPEDASVNQMQSILPLFERYQSRQDTLADKKEARKEKAEAKSSEKSAGMTEGRKAVDKDFAKDYNEWTAGAQASVDKNLQRLEEAKAVLKKRQNDLFGTSGRITGNLPDFVRSEESKRIRQDVQSAAQGALRATLGAQFTENEGKRIMNMSYDETLSPEENIRKIDMAMNELKTQKAQKQAKTKYFEENGTLAGYKDSGSMSPASKSPNKAQPKTVTQNGHVYTLNEATGEYE